MHTTDLPPVQVNELFCHFFLYFVILLFGKILLCFSLPFTITLFQGIKTAASPTPVPQTPSVDQEPHNAVDAVVSQYNNMLVCFSFTILVLFLIKAFIFPFTGNFSYRLNS